MLSRKLRRIFACWFVSPLATAQMCDGPSLVNGLDVDLPCVLVAGQAYRAGLQNVSAEALVWRWNGTLEAVTCNADATRCATLGPDLSLELHGLNLGGTLFRASLDLSPGYGEYYWQYRSHSPESADSAGGSLNQADIAQLQQFMQQFVNAGNKVPGAVLAVAEGNNILLLEAYGSADVSAGTPTTTETLFHIGSTNKALNSLLIGALVDEGVLQWDTRVQEIYPAFTLSNPDYAARITIRHLLDMTSGLPEEPDFEIDEAPRKLLEDIATLPLSGAPGEVYEYSNFSASLAGYLAVLAKTKAINGMLTDTDLDNLQAGYNQLLKDKILTPIGMNNSYLLVSEARATGRMSKSHVLEGDHFVVAESYDSDVDNLAPSGILKSTAGDMLRYVMTEIQQGVAPDGTRVVSAANTVERQKVSGGAATGEKYGLCLFATNINGLRYVGHDGSYDNFNSMFGFFPDRRIGFVLLTNGESPDALTVTENAESPLVQLIAQLLKNRP